MISFSNQSRAFGHRFKDLKAQRVTLTGIYWQKMQQKMHSRYIVIILKIKNSCALICQ